MARHLPLLRGATYQSVNNTLLQASQQLSRIGVDERAATYDPVLFWQALASDRGRWPATLRSIWNNRERALHMVATALESQVPGFQGLARQFRYNPGFHALDANTGGVVVDWGARPGASHPNPVAHIGDPAFASPRDLVRVAMHEGRHVWQSRQGGEFNRPNASAEADAYLFDLEHRNLSGISSGRVTHAANYVRSLLDMNDRLATGRPTEPWFSGDPLARDPARRGMGMRECMSTLKRLDMQLRLNEIEPAIRRETNLFSSRSAFSGALAGSNFGLSSWPQGGAMGQAASRLRTMWQGGLRG